MKNSEQNLGNHNVSGYRFIDPSLQLIHRVVSCLICFTEQILNLTTNQHKCISESESRHHDANEIEGITGFLFYFLRP